MAELAAETKRLDFKLEQVQDFTPTPMTVSTEIYYTGYHPYTLDPVFCARTPEEKLRQRQWFFWYQPENRAPLTKALQRAGRLDLVAKLFGGVGHGSGSSNSHTRNFAPKDTGQTYFGKQGDRKKPNRYDRGNRSNPKRK